MIEITVAHDKQFNSLSEFAQLLYLKILPHTDDFGRFEGDPDILKARVDPLSKRKIIFYQKALEEISNAGLWFIYETDNSKRVIQYKPDTFERINAFLIKKRGNPEYPKYINQYKIISGDIAYKVISNKYKEESIKECEHDQETKHPLQIYVNTLENVKRLEKQLTAKECEALFREYDKNKIKDVLHDMENKKDLTKKYKSVNLTLRNWLNRANAKIPFYERDPVRAVK